MIVHRDSYVDNLKRGQSFLQTIAEHREMDEEEPTGEEVAPETGEEGEAEDVGEESSPPEEGLEEEENAGLEEEEQENMGDGEENVWEEPAEVTFLYFLSRTYQF
jgi:hypothetical protein